VPLFTWSAKNPSAEVLAEPRRAQDRPLHRTHARLLALQRGLLSATRQEHEPADAGGADDRGPTGWLGALRGSAGRAGDGARPSAAGRAWTLGALADEVAMSRSAFAARFTELVAEPPMRYVARLRMHLAQAALRQPGARIAEVAGRFGYRSEAAFSRAFKRYVGVPPGAARRR
jgi:AraC-like DNA-binding protein